MEVMFDVVMFDVMWCGVVLLVGMMVVFVLLFMGFGMLFNMFDL